MHLDSRQLKALSLNIKEEYNNASIRLYPDDYRPHLGASIVGWLCPRKTWYTFRWATASQYDGRMRRLFSRGHAEEPRIIATLREAGWLVARNIDGTHNRYVFSAVNGHYGGEGDGFARHPQFGDLTFLCEFKTHNEKSFKKLVKKGVQLSKPLHFDQASSYGWFANIQYTLYVGVNKNDDDVYMEVFQNDFTQAMALHGKAERIIKSPVPPPRISKTVSHAECRWCEHRGHCHNGEYMRKSCRTCVYAAPCAGGNWSCEYHGQTLSRDLQLVGCDAYKAIDNNA